MQRRFEALDAFRGLSAIFVVMLHMHFVGSITEWNFFKGSSIFVEFFFVLSGFVLAHSYGFRQSLQFKPFFKARFFRLYPLHVFMLIVFILIEVGKLCAYKFAGITFNDIPFTGKTALSEIIPNLLLIQAWTPLTESLSFNTPSWSISIEFYMYMLLFVSCFLLKKIKVLAWVLISLIMLFFLSAENVFFPNAVLRGLSCFFGGASTYVLYKKISHIKINHFIGTAIELFLIVSVVLIVQSEMEHRQIIAIVTFFLVVLFFAFESGYISSLLRMNVFQILGRLSYSIYMTHAAILFCLISIMLILQKITGFEFSSMINGVRYLTTGSTILNNVIVLIVLATVITSSHFTYKYIELKGLQQWQAH